MGYRTSAEEQYVPTLNIVCKRNHPMDGDNLYVRPNGDRGCRACGVIHQRESRERKRQKEMEEMAQSRNRRPQSAKNTNWINGAMPSSSRIRGEMLRDKAQDVLKETDSYWMDARQCTEYDTDLLFPTHDVPEAREAMELVCGGCPVRRQCLAKGIVYRATAGYWGGLLFPLSGPKIKNRVNQAWTALNENGEDDGVA